MVRTLALLRTALFALTCACVAPVAVAQLPAARLDTIFPAGGKAGSEFEVMLRGADLDELTAIHFTHPGLTATVKPLAECEKKDEKKPATEADFIVKIAGDVPVGLYEARVAGRFGMSNPRLFAVGGNEEVREAGGNNTADAAIEVALGQTINGVADKEAVDYYKINATAGQKLTFDCAAQRIDSKLDATLALFDADGKELSIVRDSTGLDAVLTAAIPSDGTYTLAVYDFTYEGGPEYFYRLSIHDKARFDFVFPHVVEAGKTASVTAYGQNLPGGQAAAGMDDAEQMQQVAVDVAMPADGAGQTPFAMPPNSAAIDARQIEIAPASTAIVAVASAAVILEQEPNTESAQAQQINIPCEYVGRFFPQGDRDWVTFNAKAGETLSLEVISQQMGSPTDPLLIVEQVTTNDQGEQSANQVAEVDDAGAANTTDAISLNSKDPSYRLEVKEDATYRVLVYDLYDNAAGDPKAAYRLVIRPLTPDFHLVAYAAPGADKNKVDLISPVLRRGGCEAIELKVIRRDGFDGEIDVTAEGLPPGVSCPQITIASGDSETRLVLAAEESATPWAGTFSLIGRAKVGDKEIVRTARAGSVVWGTANMQQDAPMTRLTSTLSLAVIDDMVAPASVTLGSNDMVELKIGEKIDVPVKVARHGEFKGPLKLNAVGLPKEIKVNEVNITGDDATINIDLTNAKMKEGTYTVYLQGATKVPYTRPGEDKPKDVDVTVLSTPVRIRVAAKE